MVLTEGDRDSSWLPWLNVVYSEPEDITRLRVSNFDFLPVLSLQNEHSPLIHLAFSSLLEEGSNPVLVPRLRDL